MPEAVLAREAGLAYATLGVVVTTHARTRQQQGSILLEELDRVMSVTVTRAVRS